MLNQLSSFNTVMSATGSESQHHLRDDHHFISPTKANPLVTVKVTVLGILPVIMNLNAQRLTSVLNLDAQCLASVLNLDAQHLASVLNLDAQHLTSVLNLDIQHLASALNPQCLTSVLNLDAVMDNT
jgi:hypothetical protein